MNKFLEIVFPENATPGDLNIIQPATPDAPGQAALAAARIEREARVVSASGSGSSASSAPPMRPPYETAYWLVEAAPTPEEERISEAA